jgi:hypothetical protein
LFGGREKKRKKKAGEKRETLGAKAHELEVFHSAKAVKNKLF